MQEPTKDTAADITQDRKRQKLSADHAPQPREGMEARTEIYDEQQPVRRQPSGGERRQNIRENMDLEGGKLEWSTSGTEGQPVAGDGMQKTSAATSPKGPKKLKIDRKMPPVRRQGRFITTGTTLS